MKTAIARYLADRMRGWGVSGRKRCQRQRGVRWLVYIRNRGAGLWFDKELLGCRRVASDLSKVPLGGMRAVKRQGSQVNRW
jgi:hypothetical protein